MEFLSKNDLRNLVPSVFSKAPSAGLSEKYVHIPTEDVLDDLETLGWKPIKAQQIKDRKSKKNTCKHFITLQNPDIQITVMMVIQFILKYYLLIHMMVNHHSNSELDYLD